MFTGIITERGVVKGSRDGDGVVRLDIQAPAIARELERGDSVAVNGVCLSAVDAGRRRFTVEAVGETQRRSTIGGLRRGSDVNLELPARLSDRLGGHLVQGHVDGVATAVRVVDDGAARRMWFDAPEAILRYLVAKGSVTLDGVSLTVVEAGPTSFQVALIPLTLEATTLGAVAAGTQVNVEVDVLAKYVERLLSDPGTRTLR